MFKWLASLFCKHDFYVSQVDWVVIDNKGSLRPSWRKYTCRKCKKFFSEELKL